MPQRNTSCISCKSLPQGGSCGGKSFFRSADYTVALAGNPNTGKSTVFNAITGLRQHTGNWAGKTVTRAEGMFSHGDWLFSLIDLPGAYSLFAGGAEEEIARDFLLFGQPDVVVVVVDATRLEANLALTLQILEISDRVVVCLNLMDEAEQRGISIAPAQLSTELGVPVVATSARRGKGIAHLMAMVGDVAAGKLTCRPYRYIDANPRLKSALSGLIAQLQQQLPDRRDHRAIGLSLLHSDAHAIEGDKLRVAV